MYIFFSISYNERLYAVVQEYKKKKVNRNTENKLNHLYQLKNLFLLGSFEVSLIYLFLLLYMPTYLALLDLYQNKCSLFAANNLRVHFLLQLKILVDISHTLCIYGTSISAAIICCTCLANV